MRSAQRGFTLIEMLVVIAVITIVSTIMFANNNKFGGIVTLQNLAYDIALTIRQAQVYGISVQRFGYTTTFAAAYGVHIAASSPNTFVLYGDLTPNGIFDSGELVQTTTIRSGYSIAGLYATPPAGVEVPIDTLDVTFRRPDPDAYITNGSALGFNAQGQLISGSLYEEARIRVQSPRGDVKDVIISANGQINVE